MTITYANRTAAQQGVVTLLVGSRAELSATFNAGGFSSTFGRNMFLDQDYSTAPADGNAANFPAGTVNAIPVTRATLDNTFNQAGEVAVGDYIFTKGDVTVIGSNVALDCARVLMPTSGAATQTRFNPNLTTLVGAVQQLSPPQPILDSAGTLRAAFAVDTTTSGAPPAGNVFMVNMALMTMSAQARFEGFDTPTLANSNMAWRPKDDATGNFAMWSGVYIGTGTRPLLIDAKLNGTENGRFYIHLSDAIWDAVLNQPVSTNTMKQILPCNVGWVVPFAQYAVTPPSFLVFNQDCTKYWIYIIQAVDAAALAAIVTVGWGNSFSERIWVDTPLLNQGSGGEIQILGAVGNPPLLIQNVGTPAGGLLMPPYPPIVSAMCVPCAPLQISGRGWAGRLA